MPPDPPRCRCLRHLLALHSPPPSQNPGYGPGSLMCMCCTEQLPLLFIVQKYKVWSYITVEDLGSVETSLGKWYIMPCHGFGENVSTGITELPHGTIAPFYVYYQCVIWNRGMESVIDARGGVIYATGLLGRCLWNPKIRPTQVPAHTQNKDPYKYQKSRCQCFVCCLCTHISIHLDSTL